MPKKAKVNKLARMSDEERAKYLQHRADMEEEARRRKQELIARFIKNKLDKEEAFSRKNTAKLNQVWRFILRRIKCKQISSDIQGMISTFNYMMDRKRRLISSLMAAIDDSDDQHRRAFQAHTETISDFLDIGRQRLDKLRDEYDYQKNVLLENWDKQEAEITDNQDQAEFKLKLIIFIQEQGFSNHKKDEGVERATIKNDARLEHEEEMHALRVPKVKEVEMYWSRLREVFNSYVEQHNPIITHYQQLQEKDDFYQRDIAKNERQIESDSKLVLTLQKEYHKTSTNVTSKITRMVARRDELSKRYWQLKKDSKNDRRRSEEQLLVLVDVSQEVIQRMEEAMRKLEKIQQLAAICRKYEKKTDYAMDEPAASKEKDDASVVSYDNLDEAMINECKEYKKLDKFLLKMNHVKVQTMCLKAEKTKLSKENLQLKHFIKKYLTELALKNEKERPLSVKLQSSSINEKPKINRPVTCIEGAVCNAVMHERRMRILDKRNKEIGQVRAYPRIQNWM